MIQSRVTPDRHPHMLLAGIQLHIAIGMLLLPDDCGNDGGNCYPKQGFSEPCHTDGCC